MRTLLTWLLIFSRSGAGGDSRYCPCQDRVKQRNGIGYHFLLLAVFLFKETGEEIFFFNRL